jgi:hypothetical protein
MNQALYAHMNNKRKKKKEGEREEVNFELQTDEFAKGEYLLKEPYSI